jgi:hypothetical protein
MLGGPRSSSLVREIPPVSQASLTLARASPSFSATIPAAHRKPRWPFYLPPRRGYCEAVANRLPAYRATFRALLRLPKISVEGG